MDLDSLNILFVEIKDIFEDQLLGHFLRLSYICLQFPQIGQVIITIK